MERITETTIAPATQHVQCNGLNFPVLSWGPDGGRPILLLHGFPQEPSTWAPIAEKLGEEGFRVVAPVQRGYCSSTRPQQQGGYSFTHFIEDAIGIADALRLDRFDVAGFGVGGALAWMIAAHHPTRVRSLTSIRFPHPVAFARSFESSPEQQEKWNRLQKELGSGSPEVRAGAMLADDAAGLRQFLSANGLPQPFLDRYVRRLKEPAVLAGALSWEPAISLDEFSKVPAVTVPTLLVWSEGPAFARATAEATKNNVRARFTDLSIEHCGHFMLETSATTLTEPLLQHLRSA